MISSEPAMAERVSVTSPMNPRLLRATPPMLPDNRMTNATPRLAPELIPSTEGPASGFRKTVCIIRPLTASPAPAMIAVRDCGTRDLRMIFRQMVFSSFPNRMRMTDRSGISTDPNTRLRMKKSPMEMISRNISNEGCRSFMVADDNISGYVPGAVRDGIHG